MKFDTYCSTLVVETGFLNHLCLSRFDSIDNGIVNLIKLSMSKDAYFLGQTHFRVILLVFWVSSK